MASLPTGANTWQEAPQIGFGVTAPTPNNNLWPGTYEQQQGAYENSHAGVEAPNDWNEEQPFQTAWWKFVAPRDGWVSFDLHRSTTSPEPWADFEGPDTQLSIFIEGPEWPTAAYPDDYRAGHYLYCIESETNSIPPGTRPVYGPEGNTLRFPWKPTSQSLHKVSAGWTYWIQAGMLSLLNDPSSGYDPNTTTNYVLTVRPIYPRFHEIVVPATGPFYNSPEGGDGNAPIIVGGDDALRPDSSGYIEFPATTPASGSRYGGWCPDLHDHPEWPPAPDARTPASFGLQIAMRYYARRVGGVVAGYNGYADLEGNAGGHYQFNYSTSHYPTLNGISQWNPTAPAESDPRDIHGDDGKWEWTGLVAVFDNAEHTQWHYEHGATSAEEGIVQAVHLSSTEEWLGSGEYRTRYNPQRPGDSIEQWFEWSGDWGRPPFANIQYTFPFNAYLTGAPGVPGELVPVEDIDFGGGSGIEYAQRGTALRIEWFEWVIRWMDFPPAEITGSMVDNRRAFSDPR